ncbi:MAG: response regulator [Candidatus Goldiibacteriota bacterium]|jgi:YesN/AraC family two-component response regulator
MPYYILLADDDAEFRGEFSDAFGEYGVIQAESGEKALKILEKPNEVDIVIMDVMMPGLKGTEALAKIKEKRPALPVIILTGHSSKDIAVEALKARADDYIEKPVNVEEIKEIIRDTLRKKGLGSHADSGDIEGKIARVKDLIRHNCDKKTTLEDASALVGLSPKYLSRVFAEKTGKSFIDFKVAEKIRYAQKLLKSGYNINQTSEKTGYENAESFIRAFKKERRVTPSIYKKNLEKKRGASGGRKSKRKKKRV